MNNKADASFDVVTCVVSVDYLNKPLEVFKEVHRILKSVFIYYCRIHPSLTQLTH